MRTYGKNPAGQWVLITDINYIWLATLIQTLRLAINESPVYSGYGIPGQQSIMSQIAPDAAVNAIQAEYAQYFASLTVTRQVAQISPTYLISVVFKNGTVVQQTIAS